MESGGFYTLFAKERGFGLQGPIKWGEVSRRYMEVLTEGKGFFREKCMSYFLVDKKAENSSYVCWFSVAFTSK